MEKRFLLILSLFVSTTLLTAQGTRLLRQPTISAKHIVFVYADDLWLVDRDGGDAKRLTSHEGTESFPHFSPKDACGIGNFVSTPPSKPMVYK